GRGGPEDPVMTSAIQSAIAKGVLFVVAAGNQGSSNDVVPEWPANYASVGATNEGVISVAATDRADQYASFSNYGAASVTIAAPGYNILSTVHIGATPGYGYESGTSMASPMTAGVAALVRQAFPAFTPREVKQRIVAAGEVIGSGCVTASDKRVNAYNALAGIVSPTPCGAVAALTSSGGSGAPCLITYLTQDYLPDRDLDPLRHLRSFLWSQGEWGRALVRFYYRASARIVAWLETARAETFARRVTTTI
ncbi:MAG TPA: S8 family serine peptidase, partial [bacterium]|nr:S8 family serine peptidase [bacterium]